MNATRRDWRARTSAAAAVLLGLAALAPSPAYAAKANTGAGAVHGTITLSPGLPKVGDPCEPNSTFTVDSGSTAVVTAMNTVITGFVGTVSLSGTGSANTCAAPGESGGSLTLSASGIGPTSSQFDCASLTGTFSRAGTVAIVTLGGSCTINNYGVGNVQFVSVVQLTPTQPGAGLTSSVTKAYMDGPFVLLPG